MTAYHDAIDLRALRCFASAARHGNLARAALELDVTASAISQQLRKLEDSLGTPLLLRHGRGVTATPAGARLLERTDTILRLLATPLAAEDESTTPAGAIAIVLPAELSGFLAAPLAARIRRDWPAVTLAVAESADGSAEATLLRGKADIAVLQDAAALAEWRIERVAIEALGVIAAPSSALGRGSQAVRLRDLTHEPLVLANQQHWIRRLLARAAFQRGVGLDVALQADGLAIVKDMVRAGVGCGVLPAAAVREETARGSLVFRPLEQPALASTHAVAIQSGASPSVRAIAAAVAQAMRALAASGAWTGAAPAGPGAAGPESEAVAWFLAGSAVQDAGLAAVGGD